MSEGQVGGWLAKLIIDPFLKVEGITNEQARQCALIYNEAMYEYENSRIEHDEATCLADINDDIRPYTPEELIAKAVYENQKDLITNYIFEP